MLKFSEKDFKHGQWVLENQINSPFELIALWNMFQNEVQDAPYPEYSVPWQRGLEIEVQ